MHDNARPAPDRAAIARHALAQPHDVLLLRFARPIGGRISRAYAVCKTGRPARTLGLGLARYARKHGIAYVVEQVWTCPDGRAAHALRASFRRRQKHF